jgi:hypothetical protein
VASSVESAVTSTVNDNVASSISGALGL